MKNTEKPRICYEAPKLQFIVLREDIVTLSTGKFDGGNLGSDLGDGQIGGNDIFD